MPRTALALAALAVGLTACGDGGGTTIINKTTKTVTEPSGAATQSLPPEEHSGTCRTKLNVPPGGNAAYDNLETVEADCDFANAVAAEWVRRFGPDCYQGCRKIIRDIPCTYNVSKAEVVCAAARTEVRWDVLYRE
jgi:hypothetical protein